MTIIRDKIQVVVRVRPPKDSEFNIIKKVDAKSIIVKDKNYSFDNIFHTYSEQNLIFDDAVRPLIASFLSGINTTIFAYGQTGSGKTYTMGTDQTSIHFQDNKCGIIPRFLFHIFELQSSNYHSYSYKIQFLELYNEEIRDLLIPRNQPTNVRITDSKQGVTLVGLTEKPVFSAIEALFYLNEGNKSRTTGSTAMNSESSRSHGIFTFHMTQKKINKETGVVEMIRSKFNFVDLAGSERLQRTKAIGARAREGIYINYGLLALGNVICALAENGVKGTKRHIPYRDSKLTRLLEDSLGGTAKCMMIACVCPSAENATETLNTLTYANRVNSIENKISIDHRVSGSAVDSCSNCHTLQLRIAQLEHELIELRTVSKCNKIDSSGNMKFPDKVKNLFESQKQATVTDYDNTINHFQSFTRLLELEQDLKLVECLPEDEPDMCVVTLEKMRLMQKVQSAKLYTMNGTFSNALHKLDIDTYIDRMTHDSKMNILKINNLLLTNIQDQREMNRMTSHELRWQYLLGFTCQQIILKDCLQQELLKFYDNRYNQLCRLIGTLVTETKLPGRSLGELIAQLKACNSYAPTKLVKNEIAMHELDSVADNLNKLFPLSEKLLSDLEPERWIPEAEDYAENKVHNGGLSTVKQNNLHNNGLSVPETKNKKDDKENMIPMVSLKRHQTLHEPMITVKRRKSIVLKHDGKLSDQGFVKPNGLCLPVIKSPEKTFTNRKVQPSAANRILVDKKLPINQTSVKTYTAYDIIQSFRTRNLISNYR